MNIVVLYPELFTAPIVNVLNSLEYLVNQGLITLYHSREDQILPEQIATADILITSRSVDPIFRPIYKYAQALGIPIIYDLDDNLFAVPPDSDVYRYFGHPDKQQQLEWMLRNSDLVRVHSSALAEVIYPFNAHVQVVWAAINWQDAPPQLPPLNTNPLEIVYAVSPHSGAMFFSIIRDDLYRALTDFPDKLHFHALGYIDDAFLKLPNVTHEPYQSDFKAFFQSFTHHGYAIGLAPMKYELFYQCKTDLKFRDYAAAGIAGIYTDCSLYSHVEHEKTGILVTNQPGAWYNAIVDLLHHPEKIHHIRYAAREFAFNRYHVDITAKIWWEQLSSLEKRPSSNIKHPKSWWFTKNAAPNLSFKRRFLPLYQRYIPFRVHVIISRLYRWIRRLIS
jgi:glycosyltransferase involved in cell wall biosynthesis